MRSSSSATSFGDLALYGIFVALSILAGGLVVTFILVATSLIVAMFPPGSGASEIVTGVALLWGVVTGCVVAVFTIGPWHRLHSRTQIERFDDAQAIPLELIGRPVPRRRVANDARRRAAAAAAYAANDYADEDYVGEDDADELLLEEEAELRQPRARQPRPVPAPRYRRAS